MRVSTNSNLYSLSRTLLFPNTIVKKISIYVSVDSRNRREGYNYDVQVSMVGSIKKEVKLLENIEKKIAVV
mgnify:CR=1 FL=1